VRSTKRTHRRSCSSLAGVQMSVDAGEEAPRDGFVVSMLAPIQAPFTCTPTLFQQPMGCATSTWRHGSGSTARVAVLTMNRSQVVLPPDPGCRRLPPRSHRRSRGVSDGPTFAFLDAERPPTCGHNLGTGSTSSACVQPHRDGRGEHTNGTVGLPGPYVPREHPLRIGPMKCSISTKAT